MSQLYNIPSVVERGGVAEEFIWTDGAGVEHTLFIVGREDTGYSIVADSEEGVGWPDQEDWIEPTPDRYRDQYRGSVWNTREYSFEVLFYAQTRREYLDLIKEWRAWHNPFLGEGVIKRVQTNGDALLLNAIPRPTADPAFEWLHGYRFRQVYLAANPAWYTEDARLDVGVCNVSDVDVENEGDIPAGAVITFVGQGTNPKLTWGDGRYLEVDYQAINLDDEIVVNTLTNGPGARTARYYEHGGSSFIYVSLTAGSGYWLLDTGFSTLEATSAAGKPGVQVLHNDWYGRLT